MTDLIGKKLGQYELKEVAGVGGLATVYKAFQPALERWVAVKVLHSNDRMLLARFAREAKATARLRHRNILMVYEYGEEAGLPYIAMEYVAQGTLENYLTGQPLDLDFVINNAIAIARALHHAHEYGLIHRDVKPTNIMMPQPDWPLLTDFGLVKVTETDEELTASDVAVGTPSYMPPEQASAEEVDGRADMYSLGVVMFHMITGRLPFDYNNINLQVFAHISEMPPNPCELNPACPPQLGKIILRTLEKMPDDRYANLQELADVLSRVRLESPQPLPTPPVAAAQASSTAPETLRPAPDAPPPQNIKLLLKDTGVTLEVPRQEKNDLIIGRSHKQAQVDIDLGPHGALEAGVSRQHAHLFQQAGAWLIDDLESMNGTFVNQEKVIPGVPVPLANGDLIRCGKVSFIFLISSD